MRLIDADALKQKLIELYESDPYPENNYMDGWTFIDFSREALRPMIDEEPTIEAKLVKHARWIEVLRIDPTDQKAICECSLCGNTVWVHDGQRSWNYCPNCGARMLNVSCDTCIHNEVCESASMNIEAKKCRHYKAERSVYEHLPN